MTGGAMPIAMTMKWKQKRHKKRGVAAAFP
jgi:hypothetical protein